jgi:hypothetical protein
VLQSAVQVLVLSMANPLTGADPNMESGEYWMQQLPEKHRNQSRICNTNTNTNAKGSHQSRSAFRMYVCMLLGSQT